MINANELRLGNWVQVNGKPVKVVSLQTNYVVILSETNQINCKDRIREHTGSAGDIANAHYSGIDPIPLTPEVLEKCGCKRGSDPDMWRHPSGVWLTSAANGKFFTNGFKSGHYIEYLHQYQNTVFWATGEELRAEL